MACPMTPVEEGSTSPAGMPSSFATRSQTSLASATPLGAQVLALPLFTTMAWAWPSAKWARSTWMGAP